MKNSGQCDRKAEQDLTIEIILRQIELNGFKKELSKLFGLTFTKSLKQFHAFFGNNPPVCMSSQYFVDNFDPELGFMTWE